MVLAAEKAGRGSKKVHALVELSKCHTRTRLSAFNRGVNPCGWFDPGRQCRCRCWRWKRCWCRGGRRLCAGHEQQCAQRKDKLETQYCSHGKNSNQHDNDRQLLEPENLPNDQKTQVKAKTCVRMFREYMSQSRNDLLFESSSSGNRDRPAWSRTSVASLRTPDGSTYGTWS